MCVVLPCVFARVCHRKHVVGMGTPNVVWMGSFNVVLMGSPNVHHKLPIGMSLNPIGFSDFTL